MFLGRFQGYPGRSLGKLTFFLRWFVSRLTLVSGSVKKEKRPPANVPDDDDDDDVIILSDNDSPSPPMNGLSHFTELDTDLLMVIGNTSRVYDQSSLPVTPGADEQEQRVARFIHSKPKGYRVRNPRKLVGYLLRHDLVSI